MELEVKGCSDCPMCSPNYNEGIGYVCDADKLQRFIQEDDFQPVTPSWCPLKIEPIIITLKEN